MELTNCPECGELAEIQWRAAMASTDGPVEHGKILCVRKHWFLMPIASLPSLPVTSASGTYSSAM